jgi:hypothetical protein
MKFSLGGQSRINQKNKLNRYGLKVSSPKKSKNRDNLLERLNSSSSKKGTMDHEERTRNETSLVLRGLNSRIVDETVISDEMSVFSAGSHTTLNRIQRKKTSNKKQTIIRMDSMMSMASLRKISEFGVNAVSPSPNFKNNENNMFRLAVERMSMDKNDVSARSH